MAFIDQSKYAIVIPISIADQTASGARSTRSSVDSMLREQLRAIESANRAQVADQRRTATEIAQVQAQAARREIAQRNQDFRDIQKIHNDKVNLAKREAAEKKAVEDKYTREAMADLKRIERERAQINASTARAVEQSAKQQADFKIKEAKRAATALANSMGPQGGGAGGGSGGGANSFLTGALGGLAAGGLIVGFKELISLGKEFFGLISEGVHWVVELTNDLAKHGEELYRLQQKTKLSAEAASIFNIIAKETGVELSQLGTIGARIESKIDKGVTQPLGEAGRALKTLGLDAKELEKLAPQDAIGLIAKSIDNLQNQYVKAHVAQALTGKGFADAAPAIHALAISYDLAREKGERFGLLFSQEQIDQAHEYTVASADLSLAVEGFKHTVAEEAVPAMINVFIVLSNVLADNRSTWKALGEAIGTTIEFARVLISTLPGLGKALLGVASVDPFAILNGLKAANAAGETQLELIQLQTQQAEADIKTVESLRERAKQKGGGAFLASELTRIAAEKKEIKERMNSWGDNAIPDDIAKRSLAEANKYAEQIRTVMLGVSGTEDFAPGKEKTKKALSELQTLQKEYTKLTAEVMSLYRAGSQEFTLRFKVEDLRQTKSDLDGLLKLRHQLGLPLDAPLPVGLQAIKEETRLRTEQKKIVDSVTTAKYAQSDAEYKLAALMLTQNIPLVDAETRSQTKYLTAIAARKNAELELTADLRAAVKEREDALTGEQSTLRDTRQAYVQMQLDAVKGLETSRLANIKANLKLAIDTGGEASIKQSLELSLKNENETLKPPLVSMNEHVGTIVGQLTSILAVMARPPAGSVAATSHTLAELTSFITSEGGRVISTTGGRHNVGSKHYTGQAADMSVRGISAAQVDMIMQAAREAGYFVLDERARPAGQKVWGGPNVHFQTVPFMGGAPSASNQATWAYTAMMMGQSGRKPTTPPVLKPGPGSPGYDRADVIRVSSAQSLSDVASDEALKRTIDLDTAAATAVDGLRTSRRNLIDAEREDLMTRAKLRAETGKSLEQSTYEALLDKEKQDRLKTDVTATANAMKVQHDLSLGRGHDAEYVSRLEVDADRARAASSKSTVDQIIVNEAYLKKLREGNVDEMRRLDENAKDARLKGETSLYQQVATLEDQIAHAGEDSAMRTQIAKRKAYLEIINADQSAVESQIASQAKLSDATVLHSQQVRATVMDHLASQTTITQAFGNGIVSVYDKVTSFIDKGINKLTHGLSIVNDVLSSIAHQLISRVFQRFLDAFFPASGGGQTATANASGGGGFGNIFRGIFGTGGGVTGTPPFAGNFAGGSASMGGADFSSAIAAAFSSHGITAPPSLTSGGMLSTQTLGTGFASLTNAGGGIGSTSLMAGMKSGLGALLPFLGAGLGASLGGTSRFGSILGGIGGAALGIAGGAALGAFSSLGIGSFAALGVLGPIALIAGPALIIGAILLAKKAQRDKDEKTRAAAQASADTSLFSILAAVKTDQMDGPTATAAIAKLHDDWIATGNAMKDSKTRNIHLKAWNDFQPIIDAINKEIAGQAGRANARLRMAPVFASGGYNATDQMIKVRPGEGIQYPGTRNVQTIPGRDMGYDSQYMYAPAGTRIIPNSQMRGAKPFASGGNVGDSGGSNTPNLAPNISIEINIDKDGIAEAVVRSPLFQTAVIHNVKVSKVQGKL